jgi:hypothetical protein
VTFFMFSCHFISRRCGYQSMKSKPNKKLIRYSTWRETYLVSISAIQRNWFSGHRRRRPPGQRLGERSLPSQDRRSKSTRTYNSFLCSLYSPAGQVWAAHRFTRWNESETRFSLKRHLCINYHALVLHTNKSFICFLWTGWCLMVLTADLSIFIWPRRWIVDWCDDASPAML